MHSVILSSAHLRSASLQLFRWQKDWSLVSHNVKVQMDRRISSKRCLIWKCWKARTGQHCYVILFCSSCIIHHDCNSEFTWILDKYYDSLTVIYFSARWLVRADLQNRDTHRVKYSLKSSRNSGFSRRVGTILPNLGQLDTLHGF